MNRLFALFIAWIVPLSSAAQEVSNSVAIVGATLVHPERPKGKAEESNMTIVISGQTIAAVGPSGKIKVPKGAVIIDGKGRWVIPGLIDSHVHFFQSANPYTRPDFYDLTSTVPYAQEVERNKKRLPSTFKVWIASGVTSVVDMGGPFWNFEVRELAAKSAPAPRVAIAGPVFSFVGIPQLVFGEYRPIVKVASSEDISKLAEEELPRHPDLLKLLFVHRAGDNLEEQEKLATQIADIAHRAKIRLAIHATELATAKAALRAGADILVHSVMDKPVDQEFLALAKQKNVIYVPTLFVMNGPWLVAANKWQPTEAEKRLGDPQILAHMSDVAKIPTEKLPPRVKDRLTNGYEINYQSVAAQNLRKVWDAGIVVAMGTDAGNIGTLHGPSVFREMDFMVRSGLTPQEALLSATVYGAKTLGMSQQLGEISPGKHADVVVLKADPLKDVNNLSKIYRTIKSGRVFDPEELLNSLQPNI